MPELQLSGLCGAHAGGAIKKKSLSLSAEMYGNAAVEAWMSSSTQMAPECE